MFDHEISRRKAMKTALKAGAYAAPMVLASAVPVGVAAASPTVPVQMCSTMTTSGGAGVTTTLHELGRTSGTFVLSWDTFTIPDKLDVFYQGALLFSTGFVSGTGTKSITYSGTATRVTVIVTGQPGSTTTEWNYTVNCPIPLA